MKDFTTPEYITPVINEIEKNYYPIINNAINNSLNCVCILQNKTGRAAYAIRPGKTFYYSHNGKSAALKALYTAIDAWTEAAETEPEELFLWNIREKDRIQDAIRDALIKKYANGGI